MKTEKTGIIILAVLIIGLVLIPAWGDDTVKDNEIHLKWTVLIKKANREIESNNAHRIPLAGRDMFKFYLKPETNCFLYLYHLSSENQLAFLYKKNFNSLSTPDKWLKIPEQAAYWIGLESPFKKETFFLLASAAPLTELETLTPEWMHSASGKKRPEISWKQTQRKVYEEILSLIKKFNQNNDSVEAPTPIAGLIKGNEKIEANEVRFTNFYSARITIVPAPGE